MRQRQIGSELRSKTRSEEFSESVIADLGRVLFEKMEHLDPGFAETANWDELTEGDKEFYISCVEAVIQDIESRALI